jgi:(1->4)-alpha-D-glucan 1-alpha-D-glucosylmutase
VRRAFPGSTVRIPLATYRLQFGPALGFDEAAELADYLADLGVDTLYASPIFAARPGSAHGYDVIDPGAVNPELGGEEGFARLSAALARRGMGLLLDVVPNHMCVAAAQNAWWSDVLENGPSSPHARWFDIDWSPPKADLANKVLLPVLGDQYGRVLENGEIRVGMADGGFHVDYHGLRLPTAPRTTSRILAPVLERIRPALGPEDPYVLELESIVTALSHLPSRTETDPERVRERQREKEIVKRRLAALVDASPAVARALEAVIVELNGKKGDPRSFDGLEAFLASQAYRLSSWRVAADEINYRRFFDINDLAAIRVEEPAVFAAVHGLAFRLLAEGRASGFRIDHVDGLFAPGAYLAALQARAAELTGARCSAATGRSPGRRATSS